MSIPALALGQLCPPRGAERRGVVVGQGAATRGRSTLRIIEFESTNG